MEFKSSKPSFSIPGFRKLAVASLLVIGLQSGVLASPDLPSGSKNIASVTSLGVADGQMQFNLRYDNEKQHKLNIVLSDELGNVLYREIVSNKTVNKTFRTSPEINTLILVVTNSSNRSVQKFEITNEKRYVDEVVITSVQ